MRLFIKDNAGNIIAEQADTDDVRLVFNRICENRSHGNWPYASLGINMNPDAAFTLDFGRKVSKKISRLKLSKLIKSDEPSPFPALTQIEVYGTESE